MPASEPCAYSGSFEILEIGPHAIRHGGWEYGIRPKSKDGLRCNLSALFTNDCKRTSTVRPVKVHLRHFIGIVETSIEVSYCRTYMDYCGKQWIMSKHKE
jgi:hypothetical protein